MTKPGLLSFKGRYPKFSYADPKEEDIGLSSAGKMMYRRALKALAKLEWYSSHVEPDHEDCRVLEDNFLNAMIKIGGLFGSGTEERIESRDNPKYQKVWDRYDAIDMARLTGEEE